MTKADEARSEPAVVANGATDQGLSLVRGGPFYRWQQAVGLIGPDRWNPGRSLVCALGIAWAPLVLLTVLFHPHLLISLLKDYRVYARTVIAIPVLLAGQILMESRFRIIEQQVRSAKLLGPDDLAYIDGMFATLARWGNSWL